MLYWPLPLSRGGRCREGRKILTVVERWLLWGDGGSTSFPGLFPFEREKPWERGWWWWWLVEVRLCTGDCFIQVNFTVNI